MPSIEMEFWLIPAVSLFTMFCLLKYIWNQYHNDVLFVYEDGSHDSGQQEKDTTAKVGVTRIPIHQRRADAAGLTKPESSQIQKHFSYEDLDLDSIGKKLFVTFKNQRMLPRFKPGLAKKQFAVLFLSSTKDNLLNSIKGGTDNSIEVFPPDNKLCNYVTARPHNGVHAEKLIMDKFEKLVKAISDRKETVQYIFLYSWLFPCTKCASAIIATIIPTIQRAFPELLSDVAIFVLYSGVRKDEKEDKLITERSLRSHGINMWALGNIEEDS